MKDLALFARGFLLRVGSRGRGFTDLLKWRTISFIQYNNYLYLEDKDDEVYSKTVLKRFHNLTNIFP